MKVNIKFFLTSLEQQIQTFAEISLERWRNHCCSMLSDVVHKRMLQASPAIVNIKQLFVEQTSLDLQRLDN